MFNRDLLRFAFFIWAISSLVSPLVSPLLEDSDGPKVVIFAYRFRADNQVEFLLTKSTKGPEFPRGKPKVHERSWYLQKIKMSVGGLDRLLGNVLKAYRGHDEWENYALAAYRELHEESKLLFLTWIVIQVSSAELILI